MCGTLGGRASGWHWRSSRSGQEAEVDGDGHGPLASGSFAAAAAAAAGAAYDARRGVYYVKPVLRGWLHLLWFGVSLVLGPLLLARAHGVVRITAVAIYAASVSAMFGISALYHRGTWTAAWTRRLQRLDHAMIFLLIAGTATPAFLLATSGTFRLEIAEK